MIGRLLALLRRKEPAEQKELVIPTIRKMRQKRKVIISLHGIESQGEWQKALAPLISEQGWMYYPLHYGIFRSSKFAQPWKRSAQVNWFRQELRQIKNRIGDVIPSIVAHSFGTYIISEALDIYDGINVDKIILCGSIVRRNYDWAKIFRRKQATTVRNDFGRKDFPARFSKVIAWDTGPSGCKGFLQNHGRLHDCAFDRYKHGSVFDYDHYEKHWIPFLDQALAYEGEDELLSEREESVSPYDAAKWSAVTYFHQYIKRVSDAVDRNEVFPLDSNGQREEQPAEVNGLVVVIPETPGEAIGVSASVLYKMLKDAIMGKQHGRTVKIGTNDWLYDIPSTINSLAFLDNRTDEELVDAIPKFRRELEKLLGSSRYGIKCTVRRVSLKEAAAELSP